MSTDLAIAAVKAQALWDAGEQLRKQAAELHPEFARMIGFEGRCVEQIQAWGRNAEAVLRFGRQVLDIDPTAQPGPLMTGEIVERLVNEVQVLRRQADAGVVAAEAVES